MHFLQIIRTSLTRRRSKPLFLGDNGIGVYPNVKNKNRLREFGGLEGCFRHPIIAYRKPKGFIVHQILVSRRGPQQWTLKSSRLLNPKEMSGSSSYPAEARKWNFSPVFLCQRCREIRRETFGEIFPFLLCFAGLWPSSRGKISLKICTSKAVEKASKISRKSVHSCWGQQPWE